MKKHIWGAVAVVIAATLWSLDGTFLRPQLDSLTPEVVVFREHLLGFLLFVPRIWQGRKTIAKLSGLHRGALVWVAVFGGILGTFFLTKAFFLAIEGAASFASVILLQQLQPLFALVGAALILRERLAKSFYLRAAIAILSAYVLAFGQGVDGSAFERGTTGAWFALLAAFAYGTATVMGKVVVNNLTPIQSAGMRFGLVTALLGGYLAATGGMHITSLGEQEWRVLVAIVLSSGAVAMALYYRGLQRIRASQSTILEMAYPLSAVLLDRWLHGNVLSRLQMVAAGVMIWAMIRVAKSAKHTKSQ